MPIMTGCMRPGIHAYPEELVSFIFDLWQDPQFQERLSAAGIDCSVGLPDRAVLQQVISTCYQASLMREEERPVMFRLIIRAPELLAADEGPPTGLHRLQFARTRAFNEYELHRLAPAADFFRTLIGVSLDRENGAQIWGMVHSGTRWMQAVHGGRKTFPPLPPSPVIYVTGPGRISVCIGPEIIASLNGGLINCPSLDVFTSHWLAESFAAVRAEIWELHQAARARACKPWASLDPEFAKTLGQQVVRRIISVIRNAHHGGTLVYLPPEMSQEILAENRYMTIKYQFREEEPRQRFRTLMLRIMSTLAERHGEPDDHGRVIGWREYVTNRSEAIALLDEAIFDVAHFIAALAATDGAVVMTKRQELLGFGGVISGDIDKMETVSHALDTEGELTEQELSEGVGTRHRAAYRLCHELHDAIAIIISQDGNVRLVKWHNGAVTFWDQAPTGVPGF
ncbi:MAG: DNA integrity scanning protein DisA nucleotide-binding domain protein [Geobacteraceae bacterium]|nr:DNA integrity scanning protein DisA nucleotide-binding domain protein [Geobacteraceae bacterium]